MPMLGKIFPELNKERKKDIGSAVRLKEMVAVLRKYEVVRGMRSEEHTSELQSRT